MTKFLFFLQETELCDLTSGNFYVIEIFHTPAFVMDEDGNVKVFDTYDQAAAEAADCQNGFVIVI